LARFRWTAVRLSSAMVNSVDRVEPLMTAAARYSGHDIPEIHQSLPGASMIGERIEQ
jgi:hypothetical protein